MNVVRALWAGLWAFWWDLDTRRQLRKGDRSRRRAADRRLGRSA